MASLVPSRARQWLSTLARLVLAGVLLASGGLKLTAPDEAIRAVQAYQLLPVGLDKAVGVSQPIVEVALGALLLLGLYTRVAAAVTGVLMVVFMAGVISVWARGLSIDCGCFGGGGAIAPEDTAYVQEILRDLLFLGLACWLVAFPASRFSLDRAVHRETPTQDDEPDVGDTGAHPAGEDVPAATDPTERTT